MMLEKSRDRRISYIKVADRVHNMRTIEAKPYESQVKKAQETLMFYVPLAKRLKLEDAAKELTKLCDKVLNPKQSKGKEPLDFYVVPSSWLFLQIWLNDPKTN